MPYELPFSGNRVKVYRAKKFFLSGGKANFRDRKRHSNTGCQILYYCRSGIATTKAQTAVLNV